MKDGVTTTNTILDKIMAFKYTEIEAAKSAMPQEALKARLSEAPEVVDMVSALRKETVALIAEVKKASPSKGVFLEDFHPAEIATDYEQNGASAISVLTDENFFQGHLNYLREVKQTVALPVLRKEFVLDTYQVIEARAAGADAILLIAACLDDGLLKELYEAVLDRGMTPLIEVHNEAEMERVLKLDPQLVGINNRNLHDFTVDLDTTVRLAKMCPDDITLVGESGIYTPDDVKKLAEAGAHAILVGESLILADNRPQHVKALSGVQR